MKRMVAGGVPQPGEGEAREVGGRCHEHLGAEFLAALDSRGHGQAAGRTATGDKVGGPRQTVASASASGTAMAQVPMASRTSRNPSPRGVSAYSTRGGISA